MDFGLELGFGVGPRARVGVAVSARASGRQMTKSASLPTAIAPLLVSPAIFAGSEESHCNSKYSHGEKSVVVRGLGRAFLSVCLSELW